MFDSCNNIYHGFAQCNNCARHNACFVLAPADFYQTFIFLPVHIGKIACDVCDREEWPNHISHGYVTGACKYEGKCATEHKGTVLNASDWSQYLRFVCTQYHKGIIFFCNIIRSAFQGAFIIITYNTRFWYVTFVNGRD